MINITIIASVLLLFSVLKSSLVQALPIDVNARPEVLLMQYTASKATGTINFSSGVEIMESDVDASTGFIKTYSETLSAAYFDGNVNLNVFLLIVAEHIEYR